jgi:hypothetical protein
MSMSAGYVPLLPPREDWLLRRVMALERQVKELQGARVTQVQAADGSFSYNDSAHSYQGGSSRWLDDAGQVRAAKGHVNEAGDPDAAEPWGDYLLDAHGAVVLAARHTAWGLGYPSQPLNVIDDQLSRAVTGASWNSLYRMRFDNPAYEVIQVGGYVDMAAGSTGQLRLMEWYSGQQLTAALTVPGGTSLGWWIFSWKHPCECGKGDPRVRPSQCEVNVQARVSAGAGAITVWDPEYAMLESLWVAPYATTDGNPNLT